MSAQERKPIPYSAELEEWLRNHIRDEGAPLAERFAAIEILRSWLVFLDPTIYPFVAEATKEARA